MNKKINKIFKTALFSFTVMGASLMSAVNVNALEILATNYSMNATSNKMTAQSLCESAGLVSTDPTSGVTWACSSANLDTTKAGRYSINIKASDGSNSIVKTIQVKVKANTTNTAPVIELNKKSATIYKDDAIDLNSFIKTSTDAEDGALIPVISGSVDTSNAGVYAVTYTVTDSQGLRASAKLSVKVIAKSSSVSDEADTIIVDKVQNEESNTTVQPDNDAAVENGTELPSTADSTATTLSIALVISALFGAILLRKKRESVNY